MSVALTIAVTSMLSACQAPSPDDARAPTSTPPTVTSPSPIVAPSRADDEVARATFDIDGVGGAPESASIAIDALQGRPVRIEGRCDGARVEFRLTTAAANEEQRTLYEGALLCSEASPVVVQSDGYVGPVQLSIVDAGDARSAWIRALS